MLIADSSASTSDDFKQKNVPNKDSQKDGPQSASRCHNLADKPELAAKAKGMLALLKQAQKEYGDNCPLEQPRAKAITAKNRQY